MRIILFTNTSWNIYNFRAGLIRALQKAGHEVHALAPEDAYSSHLTAMGCVYHPVKMRNTGSNPWFDFQLIGNIYRLYRKISPQIILHYTVKPNIYGTMVAKYLGIPSISTVSGLGTVFLTSGKTSSLVRQLYKLAFKYPKKIFFQNQSDLELFRSHHLIQKGNFDLVPGSGIDIRRYTPLLPPPVSPPFVFLMMARLIEEKGIREYLEAARLLKDKRLPVNCRLLGAYEPKHKRSISLNEIASSPVEYLGETEDVRKYLDASHAVVLPSYREGLPKSLLEAAAMQKPIIASDVPGCREVVKNQINGLLCRPRDAIDLAAKMEKLQSSSFKELEEMGTAGRSLVKERFNQDLVNNIYLKAIAELV